MQAPHFPVQAVVRLRLGSVCWRCELGKSAPVPLCPSGPLQHGWEHVRHLPASCIVHCAALIADQPVGSSPARGHLQPASQARWRDSLCSLRPCCLELTAAKTGADTLHRLPSPYHRGEGMASCSRRRMGYITTLLCPRVPLTSGAVHPFTCASADCSAIECPRSFRSEPCLQAASVCLDWSL